MLETSLGKQSNKTVEYSPVHMAYHTNKMYNQNLGDGANGWMALAYVTGGYGPVYEQDLQFDSVYNETNNDASSYYLSDSNSVTLNQEVRAGVKEATAFANIYKSYSDNSITYKNSNAFFGAKTYSEEEVQAIRTLIKKQIKQDGAVMATFYSDIGINGDGDHISLGGYYNQDTKAYYYNGMFSANHGVTIVGWDDTYKKENFAEENRPMKDGAYIVLNSWGEEFGEGGYFYVSYDDAVIEQQILGIDSISEYAETSSDYNYIYQYDELGMSQAIRLTNDEETKLLTSAYAANVFTKKTQEEYLSEVGIFLASTQGIEVYVNNASSNLDINQATLVASYTGTNALGPGYHTLKFSPLELTGDKFAVIVKYINSDEGATISLECDLLESGMTDTSNVFDTATSNIGESYLSKDGTTWQDMVDYELYGGYILKNTNACIKAFTVKSDNLPTPTSINLDKNAATMEVGQKITLTAKILPENAIATVTWKSSDETVANVDGNGTITALAKGTTTITATTKNGQLTATCEVTVNEPSVEDQRISVTGVKLNRTNLTMQIGKNENLVATIEPSNATNQEVVWSSSDEGVATVTNNGEIKAISEGTAMITVTTKDGNFTDTCKVTVNKVQNSDDDIYTDQEKDDTKTDSGNATGGNQQLSQKDTTVANKTIPYTGYIPAIIVAIAMITAIGTFAYIRYRNIDR